MLSAQTGPRSGRRAVLALVLILAAGLALRVAYLDWRLHKGRFYDERFSFENVQQLLETGSLKPRNGYYPLLSYLPQALLLAASDRLHDFTGVDGLAVRTGSGFTAHAYRVSRLVQAVWGVAAIWLTFLIGRRLFSDTVGLVAAAALAFSPWHVHASSVFKPDAPLVFTVLVALYWSLRAAERASAGRYALAGAGVALAMSSKLTGGLAALAPVFVSALGARREPRRLALLALAGAVALGVFLLLNPYWPIYLDYMDRLSREYSWKGAHRGVSRWQAPILVSTFLAQSLGVVTALAAAAAAIGLLILLARRRLEAGHGLLVGTLLLFPLAYSGAYVAKTAHFKPNNFLPILPLVAVAAAWGLVEVWRRLAPVPSAGAGRRRLAAAAALTLLVLLWVPRGVAYVYGSRTPSADDLALRFLRRRLTGLPNCQVARERIPPSSLRWEYAAYFGTCHTLEVDRLTDLGPREVLRSDGFVFPQRRLMGADADAYLAIVAAARPRDARAFRPKPWAVRGPGVVAAVRPWSQREPPRELRPYVRDGGEFRVEAAMPAEVGAGEVVSFEVWIPAAALGDELPAPRLQMGVDDVALIPGLATRQGIAFMSPRLLNRRPGRRVRINRVQDRWGEAAIRITLYRWRQAADGPRRAGSASVAQPAGGPGAEAAGQLVRDRPGQPGE